MKQAFNNQHSLAVKDAGSLFNESWSIVLYRYNDRYNVVSIIVDLSTTAFRKSYTCCWYNSCIPLSYDHMILLDTSASSIHSSVWVSLIDTYGRCGLMGPSFVWRGSLCDIFYITIQRSIAPWYSGRLLVDITSYMNYDALIQNMTLSIVWSSSHDLRYSPTALLVANN